MVHENGGPSAQLNVFQVQFSALPFLWRNGEGRERAFLPIQDSIFVFDQLEKNHPYRKKDHFLA